MLDSRQKLGFGAALATIGGFGIVVLPLLGWSDVARPWGFVLGFLFGVAAGTGASLSIWGLIERRSDR